MTKKIFSILLIITGSFLEIYYYIFRFQQDGIDFWLAAVIGTALTLFLCMAILQRKSKLTRVLIIVLIGYSVLATSAGQSFSLSVKQKEEISQDIQELNRQDDIARIEKRLAEIDYKYKTIQEAIDATITTLHDRGMYRTTLAAAEEEQHLLDEERKGLESKLTDLRNQAITYEGVEQKSTNIYEFYNRLTQIPVDWLQFLFQTVLSIFIAIMAPLGIMGLQDKEDIRKDINDWEQLVKWWVTVNWVGKRSGKSDMILPEKTFLEYSRKSNKIVTEKQYNAIKKAALQTDCIDGVKIMKSEPDSIKLIRGFLK